MARQFNGSSQYLTVSTGFSLTADGSVWISGWFYRNNTSANYCYAFLGVSGSGVNRKFVSGTTNITATTTTNAGVGATASGASPSNATWFHAVAEFTNASLRAISVNGTRVTNTTTNALTTAPNIFRVGATGTASALLAGRAAYVAVYSGEPTSDEIGYLSGNGTSTNAFAPDLVATDRLLGYWPLDGDASPEPDEFGSNDLTLVGSPTQVASPTIQLSGSPYPSSGFLPQGMWA